MFQAWPKMAKTAKSGRIGLHSQSHISIVMASNNLTKLPKDTSWLGPNVCPMSTLKVAPNHFSLRRKGVHNKWQMATYPILVHTWLSHPKVRIHGDIPYSRRVDVPFRIRL